MTSPLLALFTRSLREDLRSKATYWIRIGAGALILIVLLSFAMGGMWVGAPGKTFFVSVVSLQMMGITMVGLSYFGSAITEEKEEQTLGLLRMTDLNPLSILLGKSTSRLCGALLLLTALFPFTVFAITLGGISLSQVTASYCTLGAYLFLLCNVALLGSVIFRRTTGAAIFAVAVLAALFAAGPMLGVAHWQLTRFGIPSGLNRISGVLWSITPIGRLVEILGTGFFGYPAGRQVVSNIAIGLVFFLLSWVAFPRFCEHTPEESMRIGGLRKRLLGMFLRRPPRPWNDAIAWKDFYFLCGGKWGWWVRVFGYVVVPLMEFVWLRLINAPARASYPLHSYLYIAFTLDIAFMAARMFRSELNDQTLAPLAILPCTMRQVAHRKLGAFLLAALPGTFSTVAREVWRLHGQHGMRWMNAINTMQVWAMIFLLVYAVAWGSLLLKRGALPVGIIATYGLNAILAMVLYSFASGLGFATRGYFGADFQILIPLACGGINVLMAVLLYHRGIRRLEALAGEG